MRQAQPAVTSLVSPSGPDVQVLSIDLPNALHLANASNPTIALARERIQEAYARLRQAQAQWLPNLQTGPAYQRHDGQIANSTGRIFTTNKQNFFMGGGAVLSLDTSEALFGPLVARRLLRAQEAAAQVVTDQVQLDVALAYLDLLRTYGALAINAETLTNAEQLLVMTEAAEKAGLGKTPADPNRARTEIALRRQERIDLEGQAAVVSARLAQLLLLDPTVDLRPAENAVVPIALVPAGVPLDELVSTGLLNRPELAESRAFVAAALARWRQARVSPLIPRLEASYFAGDFGGGINSDFKDFNGRGDATAQAVWELRNLGVGDLARARERRAQYNEANWHVLETQAQVAAEVTAAGKQVRARQRTLESAQKAVQEAEEMWRRLVLFVYNIAFRKARAYDPLELLLAEQALDRARLQYLTEVIEFNKAQFRLYTALGRPSAEALPKAATVSIPVPVLPVPSAPPSRP
jgi:outer membrane protein TolC